MLITDFLYNFQTENQQGDLASLREPAPTSPSGIWTNLTSQLKVTIWEALRDLVPFVQFKNHDKHPWNNSFY